MNRILILLTSLLFVGSAYAEETYGDLTISRLVRVIDGDTFVVDVEGLHRIIGKEVKIRIRDVDTPEIRNNRNKNKICDREHELGMSAKAFVEERLKKATKIELLDVSRGTFFRIVADVIYDGKSIAPEIIQAGHGVVYQQKKKKDWCAETNTD